MTKTLTEAPGLLGRTFLNFPLALDLEQLQADIAILGIPFGMPYDVASMANDQSTAPDLLRHMPTEEDVRYTKTHYDWDLEGYLLDGRDIRVVDCGNVVGDRSDHSAHYRKAEEAARLIFGQGTLLITLLWLNSNSSILLLGFELNAAINRARMDAEKQLETPSS